MNNIITGDLIELAQAGEFDVIVHGCNCMCTMKRGIAKQISETFPQAAIADAQTEKGGRDKLGTYTSVTAGNLVIVNAYTQFHWRGKGVLADYDAIKNVFTQIARDFPDKRIGYPKIGAGLAKGDWEVIYPIICQALSACNHTLVEFEQPQKHIREEIYSRRALQDFVNSGNKAKYLHFWGHRKGKQVSASCFSQWFGAPFEVDGKHFPTAEHYMMYQKAKLFGDTDAMSRILQAPDPGKAKAIGRQVANFNDNVWKAHCFDIVVAGNRAKFSQNPELREFLVNTGSKILVEASPVDKIWGIGLDAKHEHANNPNRWKGQNLLGFALMKVRDELRKCPR